MNHDDQAAEDVLKRRLQADLPAVPALEHNTRRRIQQRRTRQLLERTAVTASVIVALGYAVQQTSFPPPASPAKPTEVALLSDAELVALFAPPPVDPLALLDRQQQASYQTLQQWERGR